MKEATKNWRQVKLKNVCKKITVGHVGSMANEYVEGGIPFLRSQNILAFSLDLSSIKYITPEFHKKLKKSALFPGDVAVVRTGYPGTACVIPQFIPISNCADLVIIQPSFELNAHYLACFFNSTWGQVTVAGNLVGVAQQHFNVSAAKEMIIHLPPLAVQNKISGILSAYDRLIENNTRRIKILEEMARSLYDEWFVKFRFPGYDQTKMVDSELGLIPEGWELKKLGNVVELIYGKALKAEQRLGGLVAVYGSSGIVGYHNEHLAKAPGIIVGRKGNVGSVFWSEYDFFPIDTVFYVQTKVCLHYVYYNLKNQNFINNDAAVPGLNRNQAYSLPFILPSLEVLERFQNFVFPLFGQLKNLISKNNNLRQTRDLLLQKLISGEINVENIDIETGVMNESEEVSSSSQEAIAG